MAAGVPSSACIMMEEGNTSFVNDGGSLYSADYATLYHAQMKRETHDRSFVVSDKCTKIAYGAISGAGYDGTTRVTVPKSVTTIEEQNELSYYSDTVIIGEEGSYAQQYAQKEGFKFEPLGMENPPQEEGTKYTLLDAQTCLKAALRLVPTTQEMLDGYDMDGNGILQLSDAQTILKKALKLIP